MHKTLTSILAGLALLPAGANAALIYYNDFQTAAGSGWSDTTLSTTPTPYPDGERRFLGEFGNQSVTLNLGSQAAGMMRLAFDFYAIRSWDGSSAGSEFSYGDDVFSVKVGDSLLLNDSFSNGNPAGQTYGPDAHNAPMTGAAERYSLGYVFDDGIQNISYNIDAVYRLVFDFDFAGGLLNFTFSGMLDQGLSDESWGLDNVLLTMADKAVSPTETLPEPSALALLGLGGLLLGYSRRRR